MEKYFGSIFLNVDYDFIIVHGLIICDQPIINQSIYYINYQINSIIKEIYNINIPFYFSQIYF